MLARFWSIQFLRKHIQFIFDKQVTTVDISLYPKISGSMGLIFGEVGDRDKKARLHAS